MRGQDRATFRDISLRLRYGMRDAAREAGVEFVDFYAVSAGHDICSRHPWVQGRVGNRRGAGMHPLATGQAALARTIEEVLRREPRTTSPCGRWTNVGPTTLRVCRNEDHPSRARVCTVPQIDSNGISLNYTDSGGDGRPVVLIHGWPLSGASWSEQVPALVEAGHRVITYDRRGFGDSDKPENGYDYDTFAADLAGLLDGLDLRDVTLVGFSMGGGEVARYIGSHGEDRIHSAVFAGAVPPYLLKTDDNPDGGLGEEDAQGLEQGAREDREGFLDGFSTNFFTAGEELKVTEEQRQEWLTLAGAARDEALVGCIDAFSRTDFRNDLERITVPTLVIHGDSDAIVPFEVSGKRTAESVDGAKLVVVEDAPHGFNVSHADEFNRALLEFLG